MRISNIDQYFDGASNIIAREIVEGDQAVFKMALGTQNFTGYTFEVDTQLFKANLTRRGSSVKFESLTLATDNLVNGGAATYPNDMNPNSGVQTNESDPTALNLIIPSSLLSDLTSEHAPVNTNTDVPVVVMSVTLTSPTSPAVTQTFRMLWIVRYRPFVNGGSQ